MNDQQGLTNGCLASLEEEDFCITYPYDEEVGYEEDAE